MKSSSESMVVGGGVLSTVDGFVFARLLVDSTSSFCRISAGAFLFLVEGGVVIGGEGNSADLVYHEITREFQGSKGDNRGSARRRRGMTLIRMTDNEGRACCQRLLSR